MSDAGRTSATHLMLAFIAGAATGAAVALLTAPRTGRETRDRVRALAGDVAGRTPRAPLALTEAYGRAARAARQAFVESLDAAAGARGAGTGPRDH